MLKKVNKKIKSTFKRFFAKNKQEVRQLRPVVRIMQDIVPPSVLRVSHEVLGIKEYASLQLRIFGIAWRGAFGLFCLLWLTTGVGPIDLWRKSVAALAGEDIRSVNLYARDCQIEAGTSTAWSGAANASGTPSLAPEAVGSEFNETNSAAYRGGSGNMICAGFEQGGLDTVKREEETVASVEDAEIPTTTEDQLIASSSEQSNEKKVEVTIEDPVSTAESSSTVAVIDETDSPDGDALTATSGPAGLEQGGLAAGTEGTEQVEEPSSLQAAADLIVETVTEVKEVIDQLINEIALKADAKEGQQELSDLGKLTGAKIHLSLTQSLAASSSEPAESTAGETDTNNDAALRTEGVIVWYSTDAPGKGSSGDKLWHELAKLPGVDVSACAEATSSDCLKSALAGYAQAGHMAFDAPELGTWQDVESLQVKIEGRAAAGERYQLFLDSVWLTAEYDQNREEIDPDDGYEAADRIFVDGKEIDFEFTDENSDENLIIKSDRKDYYGVTDADVYFSVTNISAQPEAVSLQAHFPEDEGSVAKLEQLEKDVWVENELDGKELPPLNVFKKVFGQEIKRKPVPSAMRAKNSTKGEGSKIGPGKTRYYKMRIAYAAGTKGEFFIEALGDGQGYGLLDPWWSGSWPYKLPITINNAANSSALTDYQVLVEISSTTPGFWQNVKSDGSDIRFLNSSENTQLNYWVQYWNKTASSAQIWVQVDSVPTSSASAIYMYYGNSAAASTSSMYPTFSYSTMQDLYYVVTNTFATVTVVSLIDNNQVQLNNGTIYNLNRQQMATITPVTATSILRAKGPVQASVTGVAAGTTLVPISYAGTAFAIPYGTNVSTEAWSRYAPFTAATTTIYNGATADTAVLIATNTAATRVYNISNGGTTRLLATQPVLATYYISNTTFPTVAYPATSRDLYGIRSGTNNVGFTGNTNFSIFCSGGASVNVTNQTTANLYGNATCVAANEGLGNAVRLTAQTNPIGSVQLNDGDGSAMTVFLPDIELASEYMMPRNTAYVAVACPPKYGATTLQVYNQNNVLASTTTCTPSGNNPGKAYFGSTGDVSVFSARSRIVSTNGNPFYAVYEDIEQEALTGTGGDESNFLGAVQARKRALNEPIITLGVEQNNKITVSGKVYNDRGVTPLLTGPVVNLAVGGVFVASATASVADGSFTIGNVPIPDTGSSTAVFLASSTVSGVTYSRYAGAGNITGLDIYKNHVIVRHDDAGPLTNADIDGYDADQSSFIKARVSGGSLSASSTQSLYIWPSDTYSPGGAVALAAGGGASAGSVFIATSSVLNMAGNALSDGGGWTNLGVFQKTGAQTTTFTATSSGISINNSTSTFNHVTFSGVGGGWSFATSTTLDGNLSMATGTLSGIYDLTVKGGTASGTGIINLSGGTFTLWGTGDFGGPANWSFYDLAFGDGAATATTSKSGTGTTTVADGLTLNSNHVLNAGASIWIIAGPGAALSGNGSLSASTSLFRFTSASGINLSPKNFYNLELVPGAAGSPTYTLGAGTLSTANYFLVGNGVNPVTVTAAASNTALDINGDFTINAAASFAAPASNSFTVAGSWDNNGTFNNSAGTVTFDAGSAGKVVSAGISPFNAVAFNGAAGGWTVGENATSTGNWTLTAGTFVASSSVTIDVGGLFYNGIGGASTTWAGSTLYLRGGAQTINTSTTATETYNILKIGANTDVRMWHSSASAYNVDPTGSLYSMDHADSDGALDIWGDYHLSSGADYWSWQADFDGTDLGGSPRQANVALAAGSTVTVDGGTLNMIGSSSFPTVVANQGGGTYSFNVSSGTFNADYYRIMNAGTSGLNFSGAPTVTSLNNGDFQLAGSTGRAISLTASVINANPGKVIYACNFATTTAITAAYNVFLASAASSNWTFANHTGAFAGENFDSDPGDPTGYLIWDDSPVYTPKASRWRWYNDTNLETPLVPSANEDAMPQNIVNGADFKLRQSINAVNMSGNNVKMRLQYSTSPTFASDVNFVGEIGSTTTAWTYANGTDADNAAVSTLLLSNSAVAATHNESGTSASAYTHTVGAVAEWEFTVSAASTTPGTTYYFRPYFNNKPVALEDAATRPSVYVADSISISGAVYSDAGINELLTGPVVGLAIGNQLVATTTASAVDGSFTFNNINQFSTGGSTAVFIDNSALEASGGITYFNSASTPADNGASATNPTVVTPPANMQAGDLVILEAAHAVNSGTLAMSNTGGQSWTTLTQRVNGNHTVNLFWARFNGTWSANPSVNMISAVNNIVVMHVFRPGYAGSAWAIDVPESSGTYAAASPVTITGVTTQTNGALVFAAWTSADDNTWGTLTGGWSVAGTAQYRNTSGTNDQSISSAYQVKAVAGPTGNVSQSQLVLGPDAGTTYIIAFKEIKPVSVYGASFNRYAGAGDIANFDIYQDRAIVRHDDAGPITNADINNYDTDQNSQIKAGVASGNLTVPAIQMLYIWPNSSFRPGGQVILQPGSPAAAIGGDLLINGGSIFNAEGNAVSVGGDWTNLGDFQSNAGETVSFTATSTGFSIATGGFGFKNLSFTGVGGGWSFAGDATVNGNLDMAAGTLSGTDNILVKGGSATGDGTINLTGGTFTLDGSGDFGGATDWSFNALEIGDSVWTDASSKVGTNDILVRGIMTINNNQTLDAGATTWTLAASGTPFVMSGGMDPQASTFKFAATDHTYITPATFYNLELSPSGAGSPTYDVYGGTLAVNNHLYIGDGANPVTVAAAADNPVVDANGDFSIRTGATFIASAFSDFHAGGNWQNSGTFASNNGTVVFDAGATGKTVDAGSSPFHDVEFNNPAGGWTVTANATSTNSFSLLAGQAFTLSPAMTLEIDGGFNNSFNAASTTWAGSTLYLAGNSRTINSKTDTADTYGTLKVAANTDIKIWNSAAASYDVHSSGSLYSMDHGNIDGSLFVWGDYHIGAGQTEYWNWQTDFDGASLIGSERRAQVQLASSTNVTVDGGTLQLLGTSTATTTVDNQGSGRYGLAVSAGTLNANIYRISNADSNGLSLSGTSTISSIDNGEYVLGTNGGSLITVTPGLMAANPAKVINGCSFATSTGITGYNVRLASAAATDWTFAGLKGNLAGEDFDSDIGDPRGYIIWDNSPTYVPLSQKWRWYHDNQNETPAAPAAAEEVAPSSVTRGNILKLRLSIKATNGLSGNNIKMRLQYSTFSDFSNDVHFLGEISSSTSIWNYADGAGADNGPIVARVLSDSDATSTHNESGLSASTYAHEGDKTAEWEFTIANNGADAGTTYFFRAYTGQYNVQGVEPNLGSFYPSLTAGAETLGTALSGLPEGTATEGVITDIDTTMTAVPFGNVPFGTSVTGAHRLLVSTNAESGYQLFVKQDQDLTNSQGISINAVTATNDNPQSWPMTPAPAAFGYHTSDDTLSGVAPSRFAPNNSYAKFESGIQEVGYSPIPVSNDPIDLIFRIEVSDQQQPGDYLSQVEYILVPTY